MSTRQVRLKLAPAPMALLSGGIPLSLLFDLVLGPHSEELFSQERGPSGQGRPEQRVSGE